MQTAVIANSTAAEIMQTQLHTTRPEESAIVATRRLLAHQVSGLPVLDSNDHYVGAFTDSSAILLFQVLKERSQDYVDDVRIAQRTWNQVASDFMQHQILTVTPDTPACEAIELLLAKKVSGMPVVDSVNRFLGVFTERTAMRALVDMAWHQVPESTVRAYMSRDHGCLVERTTSVSECVFLFTNYQYRRLPVCDDGRLVGQVSRRDLCHAFVMSESDNPRDYCEPCHSSGSDVNYSWRVENVLRKDAPTIESSSSWLAIAHQFSQTSARRFPVVENANFVGQVSRRDLLEATRHLLPTNDGHARASPRFFSSVNAGTELVQASGFDGL